jgi:hypothetical protein
MCGEGMGHAVMPELLRGAAWPMQTRSGAGVQPVGFTRMVLAVVGLRHAQHVHELSAEPSRYKQRSNRYH